eukprot:scaffold63207_cov20-Prasinocladus_malaysianus.AAC.1
MLKLAARSYEYLVRVRVVATAIRLVPVVREPSRSSTSASYRTSTYDLSDCYGYPYPYPRKRGNFVLVFVVVLRNRDPAISKVQGDKVQRPTSNVQPSNRPTSTFDAILAGPWWWLACAARTCP